MMQIFLTRLANPVARTVLLVPCLLVCLSCATSLPVDRLEKGMTEEAVRAEFGEPEVVVGSAWHYTNEKQNWGWTAYCTLFAPFCALMSPITLALDGKTVFHLVGIEESPFALYFDANKVDRWEFGSYLHPNPAAEDSAAIGIVVDLRAAFNLLWLLTYEPDTVIFVRAEQGDVLSGERWVSNFAQGNRAYLLNAPPGEYVAVGARYIVHYEDPETGVSWGVTNTVLFSQEMIEATRTIAAPGAMGFMGAWLARQHSLDRADQFQRYYGKPLFQPGAFDQSWFERLGSVDHVSHPEEEDRSDTARANFFEAAREDFGKTPWASWLGGSAP